MQALIITNGELYQPEVLKRRIHTEAFDLIMATDGGERYAATLDVNLNTIIGDMDSISNLRQYDTNTIKTISWPTEKNEIDLELALLYAKEKGVKRIVLVGIMGTRMDMAIANIQLIAHPSLHLLKIEVWHGEQTGWLMRPPEGAIYGSVGDTVSLIPIGSQVLNIRTMGLKYRLEGEDLDFGRTRGVSNIMVRKNAHIKLSSGCLLVIHTPNIA